MPSEKVAPRILVEAVMHGRFTKEELKDLYPKSNALSEAAKDALKILEKNEIK